MNVLRYKEKEAFSQTKPVGVKGRFKLEVLKNGVVVREREFDNLITTMGMDRLTTTGPSARGYCHVGTGTGTPAFSDVALGAFSASSPFSSTDTQGVVTSSPRYGWLQTLYTFAIGALNGNYTEIGISNQATTGGLSSRALIVDGGGVPTSITVLSDEQLRVTYELRFYMNESDVVNTGVVITGAPDTPYDITTRRIQVTDAGRIAPQRWNFNIDFNTTFANHGSGCILYTGGLAAFTATTPLGTSLGACSSSSAATYTPGAFNRDFSFVWSPGTGNGSIKTIKTRYGAADFQAELDTAIVKSSLFSFTFTQRLTWARL